jgi:hypothetical protein
MIIATLQGMPWKHTASCMYSFERCPNESQKDDKLMAFLQRDFGPELHLGKRGKSRHQVKWTTFNNLNTGQTALRVLTLN